MKNPIFALTMGIWFTLMANNLYAEGSSGRGGGDDVGIEAQSLSLETLTDMQRFKALVGSNVDLRNLEAQARRAQFVGVDHVLYINVGDTRQNSVAINNPETGEIQLNQARWMAIADRRIKKATMLHELLSLAKLESTGHYPISSRYLAFLGVSCQEGLCNNPPVPGLRSVTFDGAKTAFASALPPTEQDLLNTKSGRGDWTEIGDIQRSDLEGVFGVTQFNPRYLRNHDQYGSVPYIVFDAGKNSLFGQRYLDAAFHRWGRADVTQGPYEVRLQSTGACFAQYGYESGWLKTGPHFNYECRTNIMKNLLLCAVTPYADEMHPFHQIQQQYIGQVVSFTIFRDTNTDYNSPDLHFP